MNFKNAESYLFRKKKLKLESQGPICPKLRFRHIIEGLNLRIHWLFPYSEDFPKASPKRDCPLVSTIRFPVGSDERCTT